MHAAIGALGTLAPMTAPSMGLSPTPTPGTSSVDPTLVTPGTWGFIAIAFVAVAVILLVWDMLRRIRRGRYRAEVREELDAEEQAAAAVRASDTDGEVIDPVEDGTGEADGPRRS